MKRSAAALLILALLCLSALLADPAKEDHSNSQSFTVALTQAIERLEGSVYRLTAAATPIARAGALNQTTDPESCGETVETGNCCEGPTSGEATCGSTCEPDVPTCDGSSTCGTTCNGPTCDGTTTCEGNATCQYTCCNSVWPECVGITCNSGFTCDGSNTCDNASPTCVNTCSVWPTCQVGVICGFTYAGAATCDGMETCTNTCTEWPTCSAAEITCEGYPEHTCDPHNPDCCNAAERTSWGKLKKMVR